ncbi:MAG: site-2 protease family protein, partial [Acidobacteriota bacterium]|nr:site-2 protease family protein [Acidobacteriota bacterium]
MRPMLPRRTIQLARIFGIRVGVGISWFFVLFIYIFLFTPIFHSAMGGSDTKAYLVTVASVLAFFLSLAIHELGHALVARRNGLQVIGIELWALGGITRTSGAPESPGVQFRVAAAGPAATLAVIAVSLVAGVVLANQHGYLAVATARSGEHFSASAVCLGFMVLINGVVLALNMVPAFPLDGSQIVQAIIWRITGSRSRAAL